MSSETGRDVVYNHTIWDAILTCARKPTWVSLIYRTEPTTKMCKNRKKLKVENVNMNRFTDGIDMVIHGQICTEYDAKNFCMISERDLRASDIDWGEIGVPVGSLPSEIASVSCDLSLSWRQQWVNLQSNLTVFGAAGPKFLVTNEA